MWGPVIWNNLLPSNSVYNKEVKWLLQNVSTYITNCNVTPQTTVIFELDTVGLADMCGTPDTHTATSTIFTQTHTMASELHHFPSAASMYVVRLTQTIYINNFCALY